MRFGLCTTIDNIHLIGKLGYDFIEPRVTSIVEMNEVEFKEALRLVNQAYIKCETFNVLLPSEIVLVGDRFNKEKLTSYLHRAFERVIQLGGQTIVLGSGGSRRVPEGVDLEEGRRQLMSSVSIIGEVAQEYNLTITLEPLNKKETNIITTVPEGISFVNELNHPSVKLLADFYHMRMENESFDCIKSAGSIVQHVHIAKSRGRTYLYSIDEDMYKDFFAVLADVGYDGRVSVEGGTSDLEKDGEATLEVLKSLYMGSKTQ